jgi:hypothetical protein
MPDLEWDLESSVGDRKITNSRITSLIGNRIKRALATPGSRRLHPFLVRRWRGKHRYNLNLDLVEDVETKKFLPRFGPNCA